MHVFLLRAYVMRRYDMIRRRHLLCSLNICFNVCKKTHKYFYVLTRSQEIHHWVWVFGRAGLRWGFATFIFNYWLERLVSQSVIDSEWHFTLDEIYAFAQTYVMYVFSNDEFLYASEWPFRRFSWPDNGWMANVDGLRSSKLTNWKDWATAFFSHSIRNPKQSNISCLYKLFAYVHLTFSKKPLNWPPIQVQHMSVCCVIRCYCKIFLVLYYFILCQCFTDSRNEES